VFSWIDLKFIVLACVVKSLSQHYIFFDHVLIN